MLFITVAKYISVFITTQKSHSSHLKAVIFVKVNFFVALFSITMGNVIYTMINFKIILRP